jgi:hypothetical protein
MPSNIILPMIYMSKEAAASQKDWVGYHPCSFFFYFYIYIIFLINRIIYHITILNFGGTIMSEQKQNNWFFNVMVDTINKWLEDYMSPVLYISDCLTERVFTGEYKGNGHVSYSEANVITRVEWILNYKINKKEYSRLILSRSVLYSGKVVWCLTQDSILNARCLWIEENRIHMYDKTGNFSIFDKDSIMDLMGRLEDAIFFESYVKSFDKEGETIMGLSQETLQTLMRKWLNSVSNHDTWIYGGLKGLFSWTLPHATGENGKGIYAKLCEESFGKFWKIYQNNEINKECIRVDCNGAHTMERSGNFETFSVKDIEKLENMINDEINNNEEETTISNNNEETKTKEMSEDMRYLTQPTRVFRPTLVGLCIHVHAKIRKSLNLHDDFNEGSDEYAFYGVITAVQSNGFKIEGHHAYGFFTINIQDVINGLIQLRVLSPANEDDLKLINDIDDEYRA